MTENTPKRQISRSGPKKLLQFFDNPSEVNLVGVEKVLFATQPARWQDRCRSRRKLHIIQRSNDSFEAAYHGIRELPKR